MANEAVINTIEDFVNAIGVIQRKHRTEVKPQFDFYTLNQDAVIRVVDAYIKEGKRVEGGALANSIGRDFGIALNISLMNRIADDVKAHRNPPKKARVPMPHSNIRLHG